MLTYFLLYPSSTQVLHTEAFTLDLIISAIDDATNDVFGTHSDIATR